MKVRAYLEVMRTLVTPWRQVVPIFPLRAEKALTEASRAVPLHEVRQAPPTARVKKSLLCTSTRGSLAERLAQKGLNVLRINKTLQLQNVPPGGSRARRGGRPQWGGWLAADRRKRPPRVLRGAAWGDLRGGTRGDAD